MIAAVVSLKCATTGVRFWMLFSAACLVAMLLGHELSDWLKERRDRIDAEEWSP